MGRVEIVFVGRTGNQIEPGFPNGSQVVGRRDTVDSNGIRGERFGPATDSRENPKRQDQQQDCAVDMGACTSVGHYFRDKHDATQQRSRNRK